MTLGLAGGPAFAALMIAMTAVGRAAADGVPLATYTFEFEYTTIPGESVFVVGSIPELGGNDMRRGLKLVPGTAQGGSLPWTLKVALREGHTFTYRYAVRNDDVVNWKNPANGVYVSDVLHGSTPTPTPEFRTLTLIEPAGSSAASAIFFAGAPLTIPFAPVPGRADLKWSRLDCQPNGAGIAAQVQTTIIESPLHALLRQGGHLFNYEPVAAPDARQILTLVVPTATVPHTRVINGVSGRGVRVYLPRGYAQHPDRRYPVLYMHDGQNVFAPGGPFGCWFAENVADGLIAAGRIRELLIVAVDNSPERSAEYVPEFGNATVTNADYNSFLVHELKPFIDSAFRTLTGAGDTAIAGSSFGGIASLVLALDHSTVFGRSAGLSPSFWAGATASRVSNGGVSPLVQLYFDSGDTSDGQETTLTVRDNVLKTGRVLRGNFQYTVGFNQQHNEAAWNARLPGVLTWLFPITDEPNSLDALLPGYGDFDGDGYVTQADLAMLLSCYGNGPCGDLTGDGKTDQADLALLLSQYGTGCP